jgi:hypothetical protein
MCSLTIRHLLVETKYVIYTYLISIAFTYANIGVDYRNFRRWQRE